MDTDTAARILIVEDHEMFAQALSTLLAAHDKDPRVLIPVHDSQIVSTVRSAKPDLVLLDLNLSPRVSPGEQFIPLLTELDIPVIVVTACTDDLRLARIIDMGVTVLSKAATVEQMIGTVEDTLAGRPVRCWPEEEHIRAKAMQARRRRRSELAAFDTLTRREREVLSRLQQGTSVDQIAAEQFVSVATVRSHIRGIFGKLGVRNQLAAVHQANEAGWSLAAHDADIAWPAVIDLRDGEPAERAM